MVVSEVPAFGNSKIPGTPYLIVSLRHRNNLEIEYGVHRIAHNQLINKRKLVENDRKHLSEIRKNASVESIVDNFLLFLDSSASLSDQERQLIKQNTKEIIEDIKYYSQTYDFRRPDEWFKNDDWES